MGMHLPGIVLDSLNPFPISGALQSTTVIGISCLPAEVAGGSPQSH